MAEAKRDRRLEPLAEVLALFAFAMLFIWKLKLFHPGLALLVPAFTIATHMARRESTVKVGFGWADFRRSLPLLLALAGCCFWVLAAGSAAGTLRRVSIRNAVLGLAAYAVWGVFQQYLLNGFVANRLAEFAGNPARWTVPLAAATLFSLVHFPNWFLMGVTFVGGYVSVRVYQRYRSLYFLGLAHALIAFSLFLVVPDSISQHFLIGPRYLIDRYGTYPEILL